MLEAFRKVSHNPIFKILFGILVIAFLFSGAGLTRAHLNFFDDDFAVKIGREKISQQVIDQKYEETVRNVRRSGLDMTDEQLAAAGISKGAIKRSMIQESLLRQEVKDLGLEAGDEAVTDQIKNIPQFQTNGSFDRAKFGAIIGSMGMTEQQFTGTLREDIKQKILTETISNNTPLNDFITAKQAAFDGEKRDVEVAIIPKSFKVPLTEPTEKNLKDYYFDNSYRFQIPENRDINYVKLQKTKDKNNALYDITVKIEDELAGGSTLKEITDKLKLKLESRKALLANDEGFSEIFLETVFGKDKGQVSDLVSDPKNNEYFVIEVTEVKPARIPDMAEVKDKVVAAWKESQANDQNLKYIEKMAEELKTSRGSIQSLAAGNGYKYQVIKDIKRRDTENYGARLVNAAFDAKEGDVLGAFENQDGTYKIARLKSIKSANLSAAEQGKYKTQMTDTVRTEIMDQYLEYLRKEFPVKMGNEAEKKVIPVAAPADVGVIGTEKKTAVQVGRDGDITTSKMK